MAIKSITIADQETLEEVSAKLDTILTDKLPTLQTNLTGGESSSIKSLCGDIITTVEAIYRNTDGLEHSSDNLDQEIDDITLRVKAIKTLLDDSNLINFNSKLSTLDTVLNAVYLKTLSDSDAINTINNTSSQLTAARVAMIDSIGIKDDIGGSITAGTVMAKLNRLITDMTTFLRNYNITRAGYIDNIYDATARLTDVDFREVPSVKAVMHVKVPAIDGRKLTKDVGTFMTNTEATAYYLDVTLDRLVAVSKSVIKVKTFDKDGLTVREVPAEFVEVTSTDKSETVRIYSLISTASDAVKDDPYAYFIDVIEYN